MIGAGLSGLASAHFAKKKGLSVMLFEASGRAGGVIRSERRDDFLIESGPNTVPLKPPLLDLIRDLKLEGNLELADLRTPRYVLFKKRLRAVPLSPTALLTTRLLSLSGKLRLLKEFFVPVRADGGDETLHSFMRRRFGEEVADRLMAPFVSGVWAGDIRQLSAAAFPKLVEWEKTRGSVIKGAINEMRSAPRPTGPKALFSFKDGIESLTKALESALSPELQMNRMVKEIRPQSEGWLVAGDGFHHVAKHVVLATPASVTAKMITPFAQETAFTLNQIPSTDLAVVHLGFDRSQIGAPKTGFGYLCAPSEAQDILGCLWNSNLFPHRAPDGAVLWTVFMGGMTNRQVLENTDTGLVDRAVKALRPVMKVKGSPSFSHVTRHKAAIPQYTMGHAGRVRDLEETERHWPGLHFASNYRGGISVGDVVESAQKIIFRI